MPLFTICAVRVTPVTNTVQPQPPLEEMLVPPTHILVQGEEQAKLDLGRRLDKNENLSLVRMIISKHLYTPQ